MQQIAQLNYVIPWNDNPELLTKVVLKFSTFYKFLSNDISIKAL